MWHNFGDPGTDSQKLGEQDLHENATAMMRTAFDRGVTHFDFANNYGPAPGAAEERCGRILASDFAHHREELVISSKAGYQMQPGPYGDGGGRKYLVELPRLAAPAADRPPRPLLPPPPRPDGAAGGDAGGARLPGPKRQDAHAGDLQLPRRAGGGGDRGLRAGGLREADPPPGAAQPAGPRGNETGLAAAAAAGMGNIVFSPLAQGLLTDKYLDGIPDDSRAKPSGFWKADRVTRSCGRGSGSWTPTPATAARPSRSPRFPGCWATRASPRR